MQNTTTKTIIIVVVVAIIAFFGGKAYGARASAKTASTQAGAFTRGAAGARTGAAGRAGGGFTGGRVVKVEDGDIVVSTQAGGSQIVLVSTSTPVMKTSVGSLSDISPGQTVQVTGTANSDGSLSATSIQVRPTMQNQAQ